MAAAARAIDASTTLNNSRDSFGVLEVPRPVSDAGERPSTRWRVEPVVHEVLGMRALLVTAGGACDVQADGRALVVLDVLGPEVAGLRPEPRRGVGGVIEMTWQEQLALVPARVWIILVGAMIAAAVVVHYAWRSK